MFNENPIKINLDIGVIRSLNVNMFKNVLVLTGTYYSKKVFESVIKPLIKTNFHVYSNISPNPTDGTVYSIAQFARGKEIDCILSIGGGSVMDCGRMVSLLLSHAGMLHEYLIGGTIGPMGITNDVIYHITVPTISGTGAEISDSASFIMNHTKQIVTSPYLTPKSTYLDPDIMKGIPSKLWAGILFECFATALAAYVSTFANPVSDAFAEEALKGYAAYSAKLLKNTDNLEYIKQMEVASINAFLAASYSSKGAVHAIADVLSARYNVQYGVALAMVCAEVNELCYKSNKKKYDKAMEIVGISSKDIKTVIKKLIAKSGIEMPSLESKVDKEDLTELASACINYRMGGNPKNLTVLEISKILEGLLA